MSAFARAAELFERLSALSAAAREETLARESDPEVRALVADMLAGGTQPHPGLATGMPGLGGLVAGALADESAGAPEGEDTETRLELADGSFRVLGVLARGGMGVVLRGRDEEIGRHVAIKVLRGDAQASARLRFIEEAQVAGQLEHPGIVPIYSLGTDDAGRPFFAMKLVEGETLAECLAKRADPRAERARFLGLFLQVCQTVAYAHARAVIHRDLKPANVMVGAFGEVQVLDWGLAKVLGTEERVPERTESGRERAPETVRTRTDSGSASISGTVMGTPGYMPPEQAQGEVERLDRRSDVFSLGAILCTILTGEPPFPGDRRQALEETRAGRIGPALERLARCGADPALVALARRSLAVDPAERPADAGEVAAEVERSLVAVEERAHAARLEAEAARARAEAERRGRRRTVLLTAGGAAALVLGLVGTLTFAVRASDRAEEASLAESEARAAERRAKDAAAASEAAQLEAQRGAEKARMTVLLFLETLRAARPLVSRGRELTVREALERTTQLIEERTMADPVLDYELRYTLGNLHGEIGNTAKAIEYMQRALELAEANTLSPGAAPMARVQLATLYADAGRREEALAIWRAVAATPFDVETDDPHVWVSLSQAAKGLFGNGEYAEAVRLGEIAVRHLMDVSDEHAEDRMTACWQLSNAYMYLGTDRARELELARQAHADLELLGPERAVDAHQIELQLGNALDDAGRPEEAIEVYERLLPFALERFGGKNTFVSLVRMNLGLALTNVGRSDEAVDLEVQAFDEVLELEGWGPTSVLILRSALSAFEHAGRIEEGLEWSDPFADDIPDDFDGWPIRIQRGAMLSALGRHEEALAELLPSYDLMLEQAGNGTGFLTGPGQALLRSLEALGDARLEHYRALVPPLPPD